MDGNGLRQRHSAILMRAGVLLLLLGLLTGLWVQAAANPRMALSSHIEGVLNGMLLVILGLVWPRLKIGAGFMKAAFWLVLYGAFANWANTLIAAAWAAGGSVMPFASLGMKGTSAQELIVMLGASSLAVALLAGGVIVFWGLRGGES